MATPKLEKVIPYPPLSERKVTGNRAHLYVEGAHVVVHRLVRESQHPVRERAEARAVLAPLRHVALFAHLSPDPGVPVDRLRPLVPASRLAELRLRLACVAKSQCSVSYTQKYTCSNFAHNELYQLCESCVMLQFK